MAMPSARSVPPSPSVATSGVLIAVSSCAIGGPITGTWPTLGNAIVLPDSWKTPKERSREQSRRRNCRSLLRNPRRRCIMSMRRSQSPSMNLVLASQSQRKSTSSRSSSRRRQPRRGITYIPKRFGRSTQAPPPEPSERAPRRSPAVEPRVRGPVVRGRAHAGDDEDDDDDILRPRHAVR